MRVAVLACVLLLGPCPLRGQSVEPDADLFREAAAAYAQGRCSEAVSRYARILAAGYAAPEVYYDLGAASLRMGEQGQAVLYFRAAWFLDPEDAQIRDALALALRSANADAPDASGTLQWCLQLRPQRWLALAAAAYWACAICVVLLLSGWRRRWLRHAAAACFVCALVGAAGVWTWRQKTLELEGVVTASQAVLRLGPGEAAQPLAPIPSGSIVRENESCPGWVRVSEGDRSGWLPAGDVTRVGGWDRPATRP